MGCKDPWLHIILDDNGVEHRVESWERIRYPGGKDGFIRLSCTCGYSTLQHSVVAARKPMIDHLRSKEK